jgi:hypothetical protein
MDYCILTTCDHQRRMRSNLRPCCSGRRQNTLKKDVKQKMHAYLQVISILKEHFLKQNHFIYFEISVFPSFCVFKYQNTDVEQIKCRLYWHNAYGHNKTKEPTFNFMQVLMNLPSFLLNTKKFMVKELLMYNWPVLLIFNLLIFRRDVGVGKGHPPLAEDRVQE